MVPQLVCGGAATNFMQTSFYHPGVPPYKLHREGKPWGGPFFPTSFINLKEGAIAIGKWKYVVRLFPVYKDWEP